MEFDSIFSGTPITAMASITVTRTQLLLFELKLDKPQTTLLQHATILNRNELLQNKQVFLCLTEIHNKKMSLHIFLRTTAFVFLQLPLLFVQPNV